MSEETELEAIRRLAGLSADKANLKPAGDAAIFDAGSVPEMKATLERYKAGSGDMTPSHVFRLGDDLWVATKVVADR